MLPTSVYFCALFGYIFDIQSWKHWGIFLLKSYFCVFRYTVSVRVEEKQPYRQRTYTWCWNFPPRCSKYKIQIKTIYRTEVRNTHNFKKDWNFFVKSSKTNLQKIYFTFDFSWKQSSKWTDFTNKWKTTHSAIEKKIFRESNFFCKNVAFTKFLSKIWEFSAISTLTPLLLLLWFNWG